MFAINDQVTYDAIENQYIEQIEMFKCINIKSTPCMLVGTKLDREYDRAIPIPMAQQLAAKYGMQYVECSSKSVPNNVANIMEDVAKLVLRKRAFEANPYAYVQAQVNTSQKNKKCTVS